MKVYDRLPHFWRVSISIRQSPSNITKHCPSLRNNSIPVISAWSSTSTERTTCTYPAKAATRSPKELRIIPPTTACFERGLKKPSKLSLTYIPGSGSQISGGRPRAIPEAQKGLDRFCWKMEVIAFWRTDCGRLGV